MKYELEDFTYKILDELFRADFETGDLYWKTRGLHWFSHCMYSENYCNSWNTKFSNKLAGTIDKGYLRVNVSGRQLLNHRVIYALYHKLNLIDVPPMLDRMDRDKLNNRPSNIRKATRSLNSLNRRQVSNVSGYIGTHYDKHCNKWVSQIRINNKCKTLGRFNTKEEAFAQRLKYELDHDLFKTTAHTKEEVASVKYRLSYKDQQLISELEELKYEDCGDV